MKGTRQARNAFYRDAICLAQKKAETKQETMNCEAGINQSGMSRISIARANVTPDSKQT